MADQRQALHLGSPPPLPDTILRSFLLQGAPIERRRLVQGARPRLNTKWPCAHMLLCLRQAGDTDKLLAGSPETPLTFASCAVWLLFKDDTGDSWVTVWMQWSGRLCTDQWRAKEGICFHLPWYKNIQTWLLALIQDTGNLLKENSMICITDLAQRGQNLPPNNNVSAGLWIRANILKYSLQQ